MIIVGQDGDKMFNFNNLTQVYITTDEEKTEYEIRCETVDSLYDTLGIYDTEERAKEVLQGIRKTYDDENCEFENGMYHMQRTYEMPEK